jgi:hypothetical protein
VVPDRWGLWPAEELELAALDGVGFDELGAVLQRVWGNVGPLHALRQADVSVRRAQVIHVKPHVVGQPGTGAVGTSGGAVGRTHNE